MQKKFIVILAALFITFPLITHAAATLDNTNTAQVSDNINAASDVMPAVKATVTKAQSVSTPYGPGKEYTLDLKSGPEKGKTIIITEDNSTLSIGVATYKKGDKVLINKINKVDGSSEYAISDYQRSGSLIWLLVLFILTVIWLSRWRGLRSLVGLTFSFVVIILWIVPRIAAGDSPVLIAIIGSTVIITFSLIVTEGFQRSTLAALLGLFLTMVVIDILSHWSINFAHLTGLANEEAFYLYNQTGDSINLQGLLLAGFIIGTLGILTDVGVGQVATVAELRAVNPTMPKAKLYRSAMRVGQSHLSAIIHTLILAYTGTALPLLVLLNSSGTPASIISGEMIATEIVRSIVGSIGLVLALPITTLIAVWLNVMSKHGLAEHRHHHREAQ